MTKTGFCHTPSPGSHQYCDTLVNDENRTVTCTCACHTDMAPFDLLDAQLRERLAREATPTDDEDGEEEEIDG